MARFKFGKGKKRADGTDASIKSSMDSPRYPRDVVSSTYPTSPSAHDNAFADELHNPHHDEPNHGGPDPYAPHRVRAGASNAVENGASNNGAPSQFKTSHFDLTLDPKNNHRNGAHVSSAVGGAGASLSPWKRHKLFDSPFPRYRHAASSILSDKNEIFLMGGLKEGSVFGDTWKISPQLDENDSLSFSALNVEIANNTNPPARVGHSSILVGNAFIIYGGDTVDTDFNGFPDNNFYLFNINNNKYTVPLHILNKPHGRYGHTIGVIALNNSSSRLYLFGGQLENDVFNDMYYFELNTFKSPKARWETVEPLNNFKPPPLTNHSMCVHKNRIYVFGGVYNNEKVSNDLWCFDAIINKWTQVTTTGAIPAPVNEHSSCLINDKMYVYGGNDFSGTIYDTLYVLDLHSLVWSKLVENDDVLLNGPGPRCGHSMTYLQTYRKLIIMGGDKNDYIDSNPNNFDTYEEFNGQEIGTMIYELDLQYLDSFLTDKPTAKTGNKVTVMKKAPVASGAPLTKEIDAADLDDHREDKYPPQVLVPEEREGYHQLHVRSFSNGPEEFRTPNASPSRKLSGSGNKNSYGESSTSGGAGLATGGLTAGLGLGAGVGAAAIAAEDKFIDFDEQNNKPVFLPAPSINDDKSVEKGKSFHNGHASFLDNYHGADSEERVAIHNRTKSDATDHFEDDSVVRNDSRVKSVSAQPRSNESSAEVKKLVTELTSELNKLKVSTSEQISEASNQINKLESENAQLKAMNAQYADIDNQIKYYESQIQERDSVILGLKADFDGAEDNETGTKSISELNKYKLERLELNNKLVYLEKENAQLSEKMLEFEPFMNNQIADLSNFQKVIKVQEEKIAALSSQVESQEELQKQIVEWKHKFETLSIEYNNYKSIHDAEDIEVSDDEHLVLDTAGGADSSTARSIASTATGRRSKRDISTQLESLVNLWSSSRAPSTLNPNASKSADAPKEIDPLVGKLQNQVNELLAISKDHQASSASEINALRNELSANLQSLKNYEANYRDALQSVNNTSRALDSTNEELDKHKDIAKRLLKENEELKLYQKASKRASSRNPTPVATITEDESEHLEPEGEDLNDMKSAHYNMKLQDLQADLFIMKQERDQLKDDVTTLKKQLYLSSQK